VDTSEDQIAKARRFAGRSALVTGAGGEIGRAVAAALAAEGALLTLVDKDPERLELARGKVEAVGAKAACFSADVSSPRDGEEMVAMAENTYGQLEVLITCAGILHAEDGNAEELSEEAWHETLAANLTGVWLSCRAALPALRRAGGGAIVNLSSLVAMRGSAPSQLAYTASKGGVTALTRELAVAHAPELIRVNALCPGLVDTNLVRELVAQPSDLEIRLAQVPAGRLASPKEVASAALWLASEEAAFITGTCLPIDGGASAAFIPHGLGEPG